MSGESDERGLAGDFFDYFVYAPVGLAVTIGEELPALVDKGRTRLTAARTIGEFAVVMGRQRLQQMLSERGRPPRQDAGAMPGDEAASPTVVDDVEIAPPERTAAGAQHADAGGAVTSMSPGPASGGAGGPAAPTRSASSPPPGSLAIPGYDALAASQVVQRLGGLSPEELEAVRLYEESTRSRRTILGRISQLSSTRGTPENE